MPFDTHKNLALGTVLVAPIPPSSGTSLILFAGHGIRFPAANVPFNCTIWPASQLPSLANAEIVRVLAMSGDSITSMLRAQEGTQAIAVLAGYLISETITAKALQDIESGTNFPLISTPGDVTSGNVVTGNVTASGSVEAPLGQFGSLGTTPLDPAQIVPPIPDAKLSVNVLKHTGGYPGGVTTFLRADGTFNPAAASGPPALHAPTHAQGGTDPVDVKGLSGYPGGTTSFLRADKTFATPSGLAPAAHASTHFWNGSDPVTGPMNFSALTLANGALLMDASVNIIATTGATNRSVSLCGGAAASNASGAYVGVVGNAYPGTAGTMFLAAGNVATGKIEFQTGNTIRGQMHPSGGLSWGNTTDPGANNLSVVGNISAANLKWQQGLNWALVGDVSAITVLPFANVPLVGTQTVRIVGVRAQLFSGTSITAVLWVDGVQKSPSIVVASGGGATTAFNIPLANNSYINWALSAPVGAPTHLTLTVYLEHTL